MSRRSKKDLNASEDVRLTAITRIWGFTVPILAICVPISISLRSPIIPLAAIGGTTIATVAVWRDDKSKNHYLQSNQVELLEQRLKDLETIVSSEDYDLLLKIKQLDSNKRQA